MTAKRKGSALFRRLVGQSKIVTTTHGAQLFSQIVEPGIAQEILDHGNETNRKIRPAKLAQYKEEMADGRWRLQNTLLITRDCFLIDGQHRLVAVAETGVPQCLLFQIIPDDEVLQANLVTDKGAIRTLGDTLHFKGVPHSRRVAAFLVHERSYRLKQDPARAVNSTQTAYLRLLREIGQPKILEAIGAVPRGMSSKLGVKQSVLDWCSFHFGLCEPTHRELFLQAVMDGESNDEESIRILREELIRMNGAKKAKGASIPATEHFMMLVKGWNAYFDSQRVTVRGLHARAKEEFPEIRGQQ